MAERQYLRRSCLSGMPWLAAIALAVAVMTAMPALAQRGMGRMQGTVTGPDGNPIEGVTVTAFNPEMTPSTLTATSDENGRWAILGLSNDNWKFTFEKAGFITHEIDASVRGLGRNPDMDVALQPAAVSATGAAGVPAANVEKRELFTQGSQQYDAGEYAAAIASWEEFVAANPAIYQVWVNIGRAHRELEQYDEAKAAFEKVLEQDPKESSALYNLGEMLIEQGKAQEALPYFEKVLENAPDDPAVYYNVAELYFDQGAVDQAIEYYKQAIEVDPAYLPAHRQLGYAYINKGEMDEAIAAFEKFVEMAPPDDPEVPVVKDIIAALKGGT